jgi:uncharacterized protein (DUF58 family)
MPILRRIRDLWPGALRQHITRTGFAYTLTLIIVAAAAFLSANNMLYLILAAMFSVLMVSGFVSRLGLAGLEIDLVLPEHISAKRAIQARVRVRNAKRWMPSFSIRVTGTEGSGFSSSLYFPVIAGGVELQEPVEMYFPTRGRRRERTFEFTTRFPFGFAERSELVTLRHEIIVYPSLEPRPEFESLLSTVSGEMECHFRGRGLDFYRIRPYEALESARNVDWKATAHTGALQVREFAREEDRRVDIYLDLDIPLNGPLTTPELGDAAYKEWFESAVECAAFLAYRLALRGADLRFRTQEADITLPAEGNIYTILKYLAVVTPRLGARPQTDSSWPDRNTPDRNIQDRNTGDHYSLVFTAQPEAMTAAGWGPANAQTGSVRVLGPDAFSPQPASSSGTR